MRGATWVVPSGGARDGLRGRIARRLANAGVRAHLLGLLLRAKLPRAGILVVMGGWHLPEIDNRGGRIEVGDCAFFPGVRLECWQGARLAIGDGTFLNRNVEIVATESVSLGRDCKIGRDVIVMDSDQHEISGQPFHSEPVVIEDGVWIGARAIVLKGVRIGHDAVIGAGAIVTRSIPPSSVAVGQPARVIRKIESPPAP